MVGSGYVESPHRFEEIKEGARIFRLCRALPNVESLPPVFLESESAPAPAVPTAKDAVRIIGKSPSAVFGVYRATIRAEAYALRSMKRCNSARTTSAGVFLVKRIAANQERIIQAIERVEA